MQWIVGNYVSGVKVFFVQLCICVHLCFVSPFSKLSQNVLVI